MDLSVWWFFLAAVVAAGASYAIWPKHPRALLSASVREDALNGDGMHEEAAHSAA